MDDASETDMITDGDLGDTHPGLGIVDDDVNMAKRHRPTALGNAPIALPTSPTGRNLGNQPHRSHEGYVPAITALPPAPKAVPYRPLPPVATTPTERRLTPLGNALAQKAGRQSSSEGKSRNIVAALSAATHRLEAGQGAKRQKLQHHESALEPQRAAYKLNKE